MPKIDIANIQLDTATNYPAPFNKAVEGRARKRLAKAAGLSQFGVNICTLKPGAASSQRHWHENEDELVYVLEGEVVLCEDSGEIAARIWLARNRHPAPGRAATYRNPTQDSGAHTRMHTT